MLEGGAETPATTRDTPAGTRDAAQASSRRAQAGERDAAQPRASETGESAATRSGDDLSSNPASAANDDAMEPATPGDASADSTGGWPPPGLASLLAPASAAAPVAATAVAMPLMDGGANLAATAGNAGTTTQTATTPTMATPPPGSGSAGLSGLSPAPVNVLNTGATPPAAAAAVAGDPAGPAPIDALASALQPVADSGAAATPEAGPTPFSLPAATGTVTTAPASPTPPLSAPPGAPVPHLHGEAFADDVGTHVQWLAGQKIGHAHIRISPQELGPVEIRLQLDGDRISADFSSAQPEVRQALENGLPRLREMLGQNGFQLAHAGVGQQSRQDGGGQGPSARGSGSGGGDMTADAALPPPARIVTRGLLDAYA